jgi:hypothetical protein
MKDKVDHVSTALDQMHKSPQELNEQNVNRRSVHFKVGNHVCRLPFHFEDLLNPTDQLQIQIIHVQWKYHGDNILDTRN